MKGGAEADDQRLFTGDGRTDCGIDKSYSCVAFEQRRSEKRRGSRFSGDRYHAAHDRAGAAEGASNLKGSMGLLKLTPETHGACKSESREYAAGGRTTLARFYPTLRPRNTELAPHSSTASNAVAV